jgi:hypothetical protein
MTCDLACTTNWRIESYDHGCPIVRFDLSGLDCRDAGVSEVGRPTDAPVDHVP